jgi:hypothetical protein
MGRWAVAMRRELTATGVRVWETRTLDDAWEELAASPASFIVVELTGDGAVLLSRMIRLPREYPDARLAVVADRALADHQTMMLEAGAAWFLTSPRAAGRLAQLACRHLAQVPQPPQSMTERVWAALPWGEG